MSAHNTDLRKDDTKSAATPRPRIERAHCVELGRVVGIDEARKFVVEGNFHEPLHFECAELPCAGRAVRIAGVNYRFNAEDRLKLVSNHFRRLDDHEANCHYFAGPSATPGVNTSGPRSRALRRDLIEEFVPPQPRPQRLPEGPLEEPAGNKPTLRTTRARRDRFASTSSLARLVDTYRTVVESSVPNTLRTHELRVRGLGQVPIGDYVTPVYRARRLAAPHVVYGGARWVKSYGRGFKLRFFDQLHARPVFVYVAASVVADCDFWQDELAALRQGNYCTAYSLGMLQSHPDHTAFSVEIVSVEHLVLRMPSRRTTT